MTTSTNQPTAADGAADRLPVAVLGCGRMGKLHTRVYSQMPQVRLVGVYDANPQTAQTVAREYNTQAFTDLNALLDQVAAVTIAAPTQFHAALAEPCLKRGIACMIEKPIARTVAEAQGIVNLAKANNALVQVGHVERFNPIVRAMARLNIQPRFIEVARISPMTFRSLDVGVVLDMMIHDIDIVLSLAKSPVAKIDAVGVSVIGQVEDICNARLTFANGCVANMTGSRLALKTERKLRLFSPDAYVSIDYQNRTGIVARRGGNLDAIRNTVAKLRSGQIQDPTLLSYKDLVSLEELKVDNTEPLRAEQDAFIDAVRTRTRPQVNAEDGLAAVEIATQITEIIARQSL